MTSLEKDNVIRVQFGKKAQAAQAPSDTDIDPLSKQKYEIFCELIKEGVVMLTLDARDQGVRVPPRFALQHDLRLNFAHEFNAADFSYDTFGVRSYLSFDEGYFFCEVPWKAVYGLYSHKHEKGLMFGSAQPEQEEKQPVLTLIKE